MENINESDLSFSLLQNDLYSINVRPRNNTSYFIDNDVDIQEVYINSNSPLTMSENNSPNDSEDEFGDVIETSPIIGGGLSESSIKRLTQLHTLWVNVQSESPCSDDSIAPFNEQRFKTKKNVFSTTESNPSNKEVRVVHRANNNGYKKKQFHDIEKSLKKYYEYDNKFSNKLDLLITYTKGQKNIFIQSNYLTHKKFIFLMIPAIIFSATVAILSPSIIEYKWSGGFICALNIFITSILSILNYTKYEIFAEKYLQLANQYDKIEFSLEMTNSKLVFMKEDDEKNKLILEKLKEVEIRLNELMALYNIIIPEVIHSIFPIICNINIFSIIKKIDLHKQELITNLTDIKNEIQYILHKWSNIDTNTSEQLKDKTRLLFLYEVKEKIKIELQQCTHVYDFIDRIFIKEINDSAKYKNIWYLFCGVNKKTNIKTDNIPPLLEKYLESILPER